VNSLSYTSKLFPEEVDSEYRNFDLLLAMLTEAHKRGMKGHAWLVDLVEARDGYAFKPHPAGSALFIKGRGSNRLSSLRSITNWLFLSGLPAMPDGMTS